jgi:hypothetical protein
MSSGRKSRRPPELEAVEPCGVTPAFGSDDTSATDLPVSSVEDINGNLVTCIFLENVRVSRLYSIHFSCIYAYVVPPKKKSRIPEPTSIREEIHDTFF